MNFNFVDLNGEQSQSWSYHLRRTRSIQLSFGFAFSSGLQSSFSPSCPWCSIERNQKISVYVWESTSWVGHYLVNDILLSAVHIHAFSRHLNIVTYKYLRSIPCGCKNQVRLLQEKFLLLIAFFGTVALTDKVFYLRKSEYLQHGGASCKQTVHYCGMLVTDVGSWN